MPIGKIKEAWVEPFEDEYVAMARIHVEEDARSTIHMRSGTELVYLDFASAPKPFVQQLKKADQSFGYGGRRSGKLRQYTKSRCVHRCCQMHR